MKKNIITATHKLTGAKVPVVINKLDENNIIKNYTEVMEERRYFTLLMLQDRWDKPRDEVIEILKKYEVPGHLKGDQINKVQPGMTAADVAYFFEEYILALEKKSGMPHNKLKSRPYISPSKH